VSVTRKFYSPQKEIQTLVATVKEQAAQIQKVTTQLEASNLRRNWSTIPKAATVIVTAL
jgi:hypothetical protein